MLNSPFRFPQRQSRACLVALLLLAAELGSSMALAATADQPTQRLDSSSFPSQFPTDRWDVTAGTWVQEGDTYNNTAVVPAAISTLNTYEGLPSQQPLGFEGEPDYTYHMRMVNQSDAATTSVGLVYGYQDDKNYFEVVFSPTRQALLRRVKAGVVTVLASTTYAEGGKDRWIDVELVRRNDTLTTILVNSNPIFVNVTQNDIPDARLGVVTHNTAGKFDNFYIDRPVATQPFFEDFQDGVADRLQFDPAFWRIADGRITNYVVAADQRVFTPLTGQPVNSSLRAKMLNPYGAAGNLVGVFWNYRQFGSNVKYTEAVFSPTGVAKINQFENGVVTNLFSASIPLLRNKWFEVTLEQNSGNTTVRLDDKPLFFYFNGNSSFLDTEGLGLITHFSPGQFDQVAFLQPTPVPYVQAFASSPSEATILTGSWAASGGIYRSTARGANDLSLFIERPDVPFIYKARLRNKSTAASSSIGLVLNCCKINTSTTSPTDGDHYEIVLSPAGQVSVNKFVQGTVVIQGTATHSVPLNSWFNLEIRRAANNKTSILVNGQQVLSGVLQGQLRGGSIGVVTHAAEGELDDVSWTEIK